MSNVLAFVPRTKTPPAPVVPTLWDTVAAQSEIGLVTYLLHQVLQAASACYQTGRTKEGDALIAACREEGFEPTVDLGKALGDLVSEVDLKIAITGQAGEVCSERS